MHSHVAETRICLVNKTDALAEVRKDPFHSCPLGLAFELIRPPRTTEPHTVPRQLEDAQHAQHAQHAPNQEIESVLRQLDDAQHDVQVGCSCCPS